jgi:hypothetical protein
MILNDVVGIQGVRTIFVLPRGVTNLVVGHVCIKPYLMCAVDIILCQEWNMRHDISVMDHSSDFLYFLGQVLDEIAIPHSW